MKLIVAGTRTFTDYEFLEDSIKLWLYEIEIPLRDVQIVSGCAPGADKMGEEFQKKYNLSLKEIPAKWNDLNAKPCLIKTRQDGTEYNALAGPNRNTEMANYATHLIAFLEWKINRNARHD